MVFRFGSTAPDPDAGTIQPAPGVAGRRPDRRSLVGPVAGTGGQPHDADRPCPTMVPSWALIVPLAALGSNHARFLRDSKQKYFAIGCGLLSHIWGIPTMKRRQFLRAAAASSTIALAGCGGGGGDTGPSGSTATPEAEIGVEVTFTEDQVFEPLRVQVATGEAVRWINQTGSDRTLEANTEVDGGAEWNLNITVPADASAYYVFEEGGIYSYHDQEETWFNACGAVAVGDNSTDDIGTLRCE